MRRISELEPRELRVLGALLEKEQTTPEYYPLTLKALVAACNQSTNRDPVMSLPEHEVLNVLRVLSQDGLVERESGVRVDRWRQRIDGLVRYRPGPKALLTLLLLRGMQTLGELRARAGRMHSFASAEEVEDALREMADQDPPLVEELPRRPGQKEARWTLAGMKATPAPGPQKGAETQAENTRASLEERVRRLEAAVSELQEEIRTLRQ